MLFDFSLFIFVSSSALERIGLESRRGVNDSNSFFFPIFWFMDTKKETPNKKSKSTLWFFFCTVATLIERPRRSNYLVFNRVSSRIFSCWLLFLSQVCCSWIGQIWFHIKINRSFSFVITFYRVLPSFTEFYREWNRREHCYWCCCCCCPEGQSFATRIHSGTRLVVFLPGFYLVLPSFSASGTSLDGGSFLLLDRAPFSNSLIPLKNT